jgi:hypothetical protein
VECNHWPEEAKGETLKGLRIERTSCYARHDMRAMDLPDSRCPMAVSSMSKEPNRTIGISIEGGDKGRSSLATGYT